MQGVTLQLQRVLLYEGLPVERAVVQCIACRPEIDAGPADHCKQHAGLLEQLPDGSTEPSDTVGDVQQDIGVSRCDARAMIGDPRISVLQDAAGKSVRAAESGALVALNQQKLGSILGITHKYDRR